MNHADCSQLHSGWHAREEAVPTETPPLIIRTCKHLLESGAFCQAAAVAGRSYCRAHVLLRVRCLKMARARRRAGVLRLPSLMDQQSIREGSLQVRAALAAGHIDAERAGLLFYAMGLASSNLRFIEQQEALARRKNSAYFEPLGAPSSRLGPRKAPPNGKSGVLSAPKSGVGRSISKASKPKRHYRIRITSGESNGYDINTS